jgi:O-antigen/teichoic acid export membrane protein
MAFSSTRTSWRALVGGRELWALLDQAVVSGANFLTYILLARALGIRSFGVFTLAWSVVLLANSLHMSLVVSPMMSVGPKQSAADRNAYYGAVVGHETVLALFCAVCVYLGAAASAAWFPSWGIAGLGAPLALATASYLIQDFVKRYFFTIRRSGLALLTDTVSYVTQLPILLWLASRHWLSIQSALWAMGATSVLAILVAGAWMRSLRLDLSVVRSVLRRHWPIGRWLASSATLQWTSQNASLISAPLFYGAWSAGALRACQNIVAASHIWILGLENVLPVESARHLHEGGPEKLVRYVARMIAVWGSVTAAFVAIISIAPSFWLGLLYGSKYAAYGNLLRLYGVFYILTFTGGPLRAGLQAIETTAAIMWAYCAMTAFALVAAIPLAKQLGLTGVMIGLIAGQLIFNLVLVIAFLHGVRRLTRSASAVVSGSGPQQLSCWNGGH